MEGLTEVEEKPTPENSWSIDHKEHMQQEMSVIGAKPETWKNPLI